MFNIVKTLDNKGTRSGGLVAQYSWQRICETVLTEKEKAHGKRIVQVSADKNGVTFTIE